MTSGCEAAVFMHTAGIFYIYIFCSRSSSGGGVLVIDCI